LHEAFGIVYHYRTPDPGEAQWVSTEHWCTKIILTGQLAPADAAGVLEVPSVHVVKLGKVEVIAGYEPNRTDYGDASP
jgi:hypothetical protein